ncbi:Kiwa anti-phage protein KwaB-like domain-containing protein [Microbacterium sp. VKM Ac-2923]|uniref:Kiwa anti-phage protein KwaB-like domain-containing protein n=1 Tax=Microbacterium sp. VKM Ac-2923 TaxID=2929476 RepID=UPI001FB45A7A|nr:Kiwa anti-phage protein KwaB-like domain-containing protein [Microbacterium sp. VKM Ac-2923]MCJ1707518.1 DUF4868 domain-containing protein [Microbacterium sp. VKM Ac-2923]
MGRALDQGGDVRRVRLAADAADALRGFGRDARTRIADGKTVEYTALTELQAGEHFLIEDRESLDEIADLRAAVLHAGDLAPVSPTQLDASIGFYVVGVGESGEQAAFIRRTDPRMAAKPGRLLAMGRERLESVDEQIFTFSNEFDLVVGPTWAVIFNQIAFERLARESGIVERHVANWITGITDSLAMDTSSVDRLRETALRDSRTWRRLRDIKRRGHLANVDLTQVVDYARAVGMDPRTVVRDGALHFDPQERFGFLHLLSEDLYRGALTGERFESQRKAAME